MRPIYLIYSTHLSVPVNDVYGKEFWQDFKSAKVIAEACEWMLTNKFKILVNDSKTQEPSHHCFSEKKNIVIVPQQSVKNLGASLDHDRSMNSQDLQFQDETVIIMTTKPVSVCQGSQCMIHILNWLKKNVIDKCAWSSEVRITTGVK